MHKKIFVFLISIAILIGFQACNNNKKDMLNLQKLEKDLTANVNSTFDEAKADAFVNACQSYANKYPKDSATAMYLFKSAQITMNYPIPEKANKSIALFDRLLKDFPNSKYVADALFMKGFYLENNLKNLVKAKETYLEFLKLFPKHQLASDVKACINNLGKSPEQIIKEFEEKNK